MASCSEENLSCPICYEIFQEPVILACSHSFCKACLQRWWTEKTSLVCPVCKRRSLRRNPPLNLALRNLCEDFLKEKTERHSSGTEDLCSLHSEKLKLFCLDDQQPVCVVCLHSNTHNNHCIRPIDEAAQEYRGVLRELLKPRQEKLDLLNDVKGNFDQTAQDIEVQAQDTEKQIKGVFVMLQYFLREEAQRRIDAVRKEKNQKIQTMKSQSEALSREIASLSDTVRNTEEVLRAADLSFLQNYKTAAKIAQHSLPDVPQPIPEGPIDKTKHLNNLSYNMLDSVREKVTSSLTPKIAVSETTVESFEDLMGKLMAMHSQTRTSTQATQPHRSTLASQDQTSTQAIQPHRSTLASQDQTSTQATQPHRSTLASQDQTSTQATQPHRSTLASQVQTSTQATQPHRSTLASQDQTSTQATQPHRSTLASQVQTSTQATQPHRSTLASQASKFTLPSLANTSTQAKSVHSAVLEELRKKF